MNLPALRGAGLNSFIHSISPVILCPRTYPVACFHIRSSSSRFLYYLKQQVSRPTSVYSDPAEAKTDGIKTWAVSVSKPSRIRNASSQNSLLQEVDQKGRKRKGTLGIENGAIFFASESDKVRCSHSIIDISVIICILYRLPYSSGRLHPSFPSTSINPSISSWRSLALHQQVYTSTQGQKMQPRQL